jgi:hypothetical protein
MCSLRVQRSQIAPMREPGTSDLACRPRLSYRQGTTRPVRLAVRTSASHVENRGSIPLRGANRILCIIINKLYDPTSLSQQELTPSYNSITYEKVGHCRGLDRRTDRAGKRAPISLKGAYCDPQGPFPLTALDDVSLLAFQLQGEAMLRCLLWALVAAVQPRRCRSQTIFASGNSR